MISLVISIAFLLLLLACSIITILFIYQKKQNIYFETIEKMKHDHEKNILKTQLEIQEQTFQFMSREIHDNISLSLTLAKLNLNTLDWNHPTKTKKQIESSLEQISKSIADLSDLSKSMNSDLISSQGLIEVLKNETRRIRELDLFELDYVIGGTPIFMESQKELIIFRIIQEAFNNVIKHAKPTHVELNLEYNADHIRVLIADNGQGFCVPIDQNTVLHAGLVNMQTRAALFNGKATIESVRGIGTKVMITIPY